MGAAEPVSVVNEHDDGAMHAEPPTDQLPVAKPAGGGLAAGVAGVVLCILLIMGVGMLVAQVVASGRGQPGPGVLIVGVHVAGAVAGAFCYRLGRRRRGPGRLLGLLAIVVIAVLLLWFFWWSPY